MHHLHVWQLDENHRALEAHVVVQDHSNGGQLKRSAKELLFERFGIGHITLELEGPGEREGCASDEPSSNCFEASWRGENVT